MRALLADRPTLADGVVQAMRDGIRSRTFVPEATYSVQQIADLLGVSRSPVREGLLKLEQAGLVSFSRNRGFTVVLPRSRDIAEIFAVRLAIEPPAAARVALRADDAVLAEVDAALTALREAAERGDEAAFWRHDHDVHRLLLDGAGNPRAARIIADLRQTTQLLGPPTSASGRDFVQIFGEHEPIVQAVVARDPDAAAQAMGEHLTNTGQLLIAQAEDVDVADLIVTDLWHDVVG